MKRSILWVGCATIAALAGLLVLRPTAETAAPAYLDRDRVALGADLYAQNCAVCHGRNLEGEPGWRTRDADGLLPAPPHDASGHTSHHPDGQLFAITKHGTEAIVGGGYKSRMPGFADTLSDAELRSVLAYIKSTWPE